MKRILFLFLMTLTGHLLRAQSNYAVSTLNSPSNNNSFLESYGVTKSPASVDVDLYTGSARVTVPLCELESRELKLPIYLTYIGGRGIKVQDVANQVGLGWELDAGGYISRIVRGLPDENVNGYLGTNGDGHNVKNSMTGAPPYNSNTILDQEPDLFYVRTPFASFHFTFDDNGNAVIPNDNGYKIIHNLYNFSGVGNTYFEVIDDQGNQYYFGSTPDSQDGVTTYKSIETHTGHVNTYSYTFPTTWHLDKIVTFNNKDLVTLTYQTGPNYSVVNKIWNASSFYSYNGGGHYTGYYNGSVAPNTNYTAPKYVQTIVSRLGEVDFAYSFDRQDFTAVGRLASVTVKGYNPQTGQNSSVLKTFNLNYSYFGAPSTDSSALRLRLDNITLTGSTPLTSGPLTINSFDYNTTKNLPSRLSPQFDYWGYYNDDPSKTPDTYTLYPDQTNRAPNLASAQANILTGIHHLTGQVTQLQYELNTFYDNGNIPGSGLRVNQLSKSAPNSGATITTQYVYNDASGNSTGMIYGFKPGNYLHMILSAVSGNYDASWNQSISIPGLVFPAWYVTTMSTTPYNIYDLSGNYLGYSAVKEVNMNGGYTISKFTNFSDFQDIYSTTVLPLPGAYSGEGAAPTFQGQPLGTIYSYDYSYKRGLLLDKTVYAANGNKVTETSNTYGVVSPMSSVTSYGYKPFQWEGFSNYVYEYYSTHTESYRLTQTVQKDFDQANQASFVQKTNSYTYCPNYRSVAGITTSDSKGASRTQQFFHADDSGIPLLTTGESTALQAMTAANRKNVLIHQTDTRNGVIHQLHNTYGAALLNPSGTNYYLTTTSAYAGSSLVKSQSYQYDPVTSNMISSNMTGGKSVSFIYDYNESIPVARAVNASRSITNALTPAQTSGWISIQGGSGGSTVGSFTTSAAGSITVAMPPGSYLAGSGGVTAFFTFYLSGPSTGSGDLCNSSVSGYTCSASNSVTFNNMPAGNYTLSVSAIDNTASSSSTIYFSYSYTGWVMQTTNISECFFEGFEQAGNITNVAHTGSGSYSGTYYVPFTPPNSRSYVVQWWSYSGGIWTFNEQSYTGAYMALTGQIDDVRVFPADAQITSYTFSPLVGSTGIVDSSAQTFTFEYDAYQRRKVDRDKDGNILKLYDYEYQALNHPVSNVAESGTFTRNNCAAGGTPATVTYTVPAGTYSSVISQADANQQAINDVNANGQAYANAHGSCTFSNAAQSVLFTRNNCDPAATPNSVYYTVPAGKHTSIISQADADQQATNDINANGQAYANANAVCIFKNVAESGTFTRNNCTCNGTGSTVTYTVSAGMYSSTVSQADANQQAINDVNTNGQTYANNHGTCSTNCTGTSHKLVNCVCETGYLDIISATQLGTKCSTKWGYFFSDGTSQYDHTTITTGPCRL